MFGAGGVASLQTAQQFSLETTTLLAVAETHRASDLWARHVREVPELAMPHLHDLVEGDVTVLGHLLETALTDGCVLWLTHVDEARHAELDELFGPGLVHVVGEARGGRVPLALNPASVVRQWATDPRHQPFLRQALHGLDAVRLPRPLVTALETAGVDFVRHGRFARAINNPRVIAYVVVMVYSALRALPVTFVKQFHGSLVVLWSIDLITAIPYTWGVLAMVTARSWWVRVAGVLVTAVTFVTPYVYFWMHGRHYPPHVVVVVVALIVGGVALEAGKVARDRSVTKRLASAPLRDPAPYATH